MDLAHRTEAGQSGMGGVSHACGDGALGEFRREHLGEFELLCGACVDEGNDAAEVLAEVGLRLLQGGADGLCGGVAAEGDLPVVPGDCFAEEVWCGVVDGCDEDGGGAGAGPGPPAVAYAIRGDDGAVGPDPVGELQPSDLGNT